MKSSKKLSIAIHPYGRTGSSQMSIELECPDLGCKGGPGGAKWKSPLLLYWQAYKELDRHLLYNHPFGTMKKLVQKVSVGDKDPQIEGEITPTFDASGLSQRQPDLTSAGLQSNKTARRKKRTRKYQNAKKVRGDTSRYEVITDINELESSAAIYRQLEANRRHPLPDSGELQRGEGGSEQGALLYRPPCLICLSNTVHFDHEEDEICADCYPQNCKQCGSYNFRCKYFIGDGDYTHCLDYGNLEKFLSQTSQTRVENQLHNFSQQHSHLQIEEGCHGGPEPYVNSHLQIQEGCHGEHRPYVNVQVEKEMVNKETIEETDKESIHDEEEVVIAELETVPSLKNQHQNEDSSVPEVNALMVDKEESVESTTEQKSVRKQGSYPSVSWVLQKKADPSTYQELYPASTLNLVASDDNETRRCSSPQIEREATTVSDQSTVPSSVQEHQNDERQGEERDEHVPNPSVHRQYIPPTTTDVHGKQFTTVLTQLIKSKPTVEDVKPKPGADGLEGDQLLPGDQLMS